jgi:hypothetical protein
MSLVPSAVPYELIDPRDTLNTPPPPMVVQDMLPAGSVIGLTSPPGVGKTWLAMELMRAVSQGGDALGHFGSDQGGVLLIGHDSSIFDYARQWKRITLSDREAWNAIDHEDRGERPFSNVRWLIQSSFALDRAETVAKVIATHNAFQWATEPRFLKYDEWNEDEQKFVASEEPFWPHGFRLVIMDTFSRVYTGNQNDAAETDRAMGHARLIADATGAAVLILHHNAKKSEHNDGETWRGSSAMQGSLDAWLNLTQSKVDPYAIRGSWKKFRGITPADFDYRMKVSGPRVASLSFVNEIGKGGDTDALSLAIVGFLQQMNRPCLLSEIREGIWPQFQDVWKNEASFRVAISNRTTGNLPVTRLFHKISQGVGRPALIELKKES